MVRICFFSLQFAGEETRLLPARDVPEIYIELRPAVAVNMPSELRCLEGAKPMPPVTRCRQPKERLIGRGSFGALGPDAGGLGRVKMGQKLYCAFCLVAHKKLSSIHGATLAHLFGCLHFSAWKMQTQAVWLTSLAC
jgi:hypothetical protein